MTRFGWPMAAVVALASSCGRCGKTAEGPVDAGGGAPTAASLRPQARVRHSLDLRSALLLAFPEYRGVPTVEGRAILTRQLTGARDWAALRAEHLQLNGFTADAEGGLGGNRPPYRFELEARGDRAVASIALPLDGETIMRLFQTPTPMSSADLGLLLPRGGDLSTEREVFELRVSYTAQSENRAAFLVRQVALLLLRNGQWKANRLPEGWSDSPDAGLDSLPERFELELEGKGDGATLWAHRDGRFVDVLYGLLTDVPASADGGGDGR